MVVTFGVVLVGGLAVQCNFIRMEANKPLPSFSTDTSLALNDLQ